MAHPQDPKDSVDLVRRVASGDDASLGALLERYLPRLRAFVRLRVDAGMRQRESCSDLVQSVCRQVLEGASGFEWRSEEAFRGWLFKTALNKLRERARFHRAERRNPKHERAADSNGDDHLLPMYLRVTTPTEAAAAHELAERIERAFDRLPEDYREVITLSRVVGLSRSEVAKAMGRSEGAVSMLLSRALLELVAVLDGRRDPAP